jgi:hypothetical protein
MTRCIVCGARFEKRSRVHVYCSTECKRTDEFVAAPVNNGPERTLDEVGEAFGLSKSRIGQIEQEALAKLRAVMHREDFL